MKIKKPIIIILGEPNSIFTEILSKALNKKKIKKKINYPIVIIGSKNLLDTQLKVLRKKINFSLINPKNVIHNKLKKGLYLIDVKYNFKKPFDIISNKSKNYISKCFDIGVKFLNEKKSEILINGPVSKKHFLENKFPGVTEYIFNKSKKKISKNPIMLIFNKNFSVSPITTHIPLKNVNKNINRKLVENNIIKINNFYKEKLNQKPKIAVLGINPHCESTSKVSEENAIIVPTIKKLKKKKLYIDGPFSADTFFLKNNMKKFNTVVGMYHDQVLTPFKTIFGFDASNITLGLPFIRISVDHGPNEDMIGKNKSNTKSIENIFNLIHSLK